MEKENIKELITAILEEYIKSDNWTDGYSYFIFEAGADDSNSNKVIADHLSGRKKKTFSNADLAQLALKEIKNL